MAAVLCFSFELSGLGALFPDPDCSEDCPSERSGAPCPPNCHACSCCSLPKSAPPARPATELPRAHARLLEWPGTSDQPAAPDPAEILHIPKLLRA